MGVPRGACAGSEGNDRASKARRRLGGKWLEQANDKTLSAGIPLHFKQFGHARNNPLVQCYMAQGLKIKAAFAQAVNDGAELAPTEKGGATYKGRVYREKPKHWHALQASLNQLSTT